MPTLADLFRLDPNVERLTLLPRLRGTLPSDPGYELKGSVMGERYMPDVIAPKVLYDFIRAVKAPARAARGEALDEEEALNTAMNIMGGGLATSGGTPAGSLGMGARVGGKTIRELLYGDKPNLTPAEKSAITRFEKELKVPAVRRREEMRATGGDIVLPTPDIVLLKDIGMRPEKLVGRTLVPIKGDLSTVGGQVTQVAGVPLEKPVLRQGGRLYPQIEQNYQQGIGWAADLGAASNKIKNFEKFADQDPLGVFVGMADTGIDFSHHMAEPLVGQIKSIGLSKGAIDAFNKAVRNTASESDPNKFPFKDFVGVDSPAVWDQMKERGPLRKAIVKTMRKDEFTKMGFPHAEDVVNVMSEKQLFPFEAGRTFIEPTLGAGPITPDFQHGTYSTGIPGRYAGGLVNAQGQVVGVPAPLLFPQMFAEKAAAGGTQFNVHRSMELKQSGEKFTEQALDPLMKFLGY